MKILRINNLQDMLMYASKFVDILQKDKKESIYLIMISIIKKLSSTIKGYNQTFKFIESAKDDSVESKKDNY